MCPAVQLVESQCLCFVLFFCAELGELLKNNEERMKKQREELEDLKQNATDVRDQIQAGVQKYSNCV